MDVVKGYEPGLVVGGGELALSAAALPPSVPHPGRVYLESLGEGSRQAIARSLDVLVEVFSGEPQERGVGLGFPWWCLRYSHTAAIRSRLQERCAPATANKALSALRRVLKESWRLGLMTVEDYQRAADLRNIQGSTLPAGRDINPGEVSALLGNCTTGDRNIDHRDGAVLAVLLVGLRRSEVATLALEDYTPDEGRLTVRKAKRNKQRVVYLPEGGRAALADWLQRRGSDTGPLFLPVNKGDRIIHQNKPMTSQAVQVIVDRRRGGAAVASCSPHDFRRTFVGNLLDAGADLSVVQQLAGHSSPTTTARYDRRPDRAKQDAVARLHIPYRRA